LKLIFNFCLPQVNNTAFKFAPVENGEKRIELSIDDDRTILKLSSWVEGLGWCGQKTMEIDADLLDDMHRMLAAARVRIRRDPGSAGSNKVLSFPG
jgi:hypothetical protein